MGYALRVKRKDAEKVRKKLVRDRILDGDRSIVEDDEFIVFPLKKWIPGAIEIELPPRKRKKSPYEKIRELVPEDVNIPDYWEKFGDIVLIPPLESYDIYGSAVGRAFSKVLHAKTVAIYRGTRGEFRKPVVEVIYGSDTETVHMENGIKYKFDVSKIMFSSGNVNERIRMAKIDASGDIVVDMFAGIGYFTLPLAKYAGAKKVYACEKNPVAMRYLLENIRLNSLSNIVPLLGDNREVVPLRIADRILMGYIHTENFLDTAFGVLKKNGGIIHYHDTFTTEELNWKTEKILMAYGEKNGFEVEIIHRRIVKSYAPHIWHVVLDARAFPKH